jgi:hypothetical protein
MKARFFTKLFLLLVLFTFFSCSGKHDRASSLLSFPVKKSEIRGAKEASEDFTFAAAVCAFGMLLRESPYKSSADFTMAETLAESSLGRDEFGYRRGFVQLLKAAKSAKALSK